MSARVLPHLELAATFPAMRLIDPRRPAADVAAELAHMVETLPAERWNTILPLSERIELPHPEHDRCDWCADRLAVTTLSWEAETRDVQSCIRCIEAVSVEARMHSGGHDPDDEPLPWVRWFEGIDGDVPAVSGIEFAEQAVATVILAHYAHRRNRFLAAQQVQGLVA